MANQKTNTDTVTSGTQLKRQFWTINKHRRSTIDYFNPIYMVSEASLNRR